MTVQTLVDEMQLMFPQLDDATILQQLNNVHYQLCRDYRVRNGKETFSSFVAGTQSYSVPSVNGTPAEIYGATFYQSSGNGTPLTPATVRDLQNTNPGYDTDIYGTGTPVQYYTDGGAIGATSFTVGFFPIPNQTSSGGYPKVIFNVSYYETLVLSSPVSGVSTDQMPPAVGGAQAWYYGTLRRLAERLNDARLSEFIAMEKKERRALAKTFARAEDAQPSNRTVGFLQSKRK